MFFWNKKKKDVTLKVVLVAAAAGALAAACVIVVYEFFKSEKGHALVSKVKGVVKSKLKKADAAEYACVELVEETIEI